MIVRAARILLALLLAITASVSSAQSPAERSPGTQAYIALVRADQLRDGGRSAEAAQGYRNAYALYQRLQKEQPEWNPEIVAYRLSYCANQIKLLEPEAPGQPAQSPTASPGSDSGGARLDSIRRENDLLKQRLSEAEEKLRRQSDREKLVARIAALEGENRRLASLQVDPNELAKLRGEAAEQRRRAEAAHQAAATAERNLQLSAQESRAALTEIARERQQTMARLRALEQSQQAQTAELETLRGEKARLDAQAAELEALTEKAETAEALAKQLDELEAAMHALRSENTSLLIANGELALKAAEAADSEALRARASALEAESAQLRADLAGATGELSSLRSQTEATAEAHAMEKQNWVKAQQEADMLRQALEGDVQRLAAELESLEHRPRNTLQLVVNSDSRSPDYQAIAPALQLEQSGALAEAQALYAEILQQNSRSLPALKGQARCQFQLEAFKDCVDTLERAIRISPKDLDLHLLQGMALFRAGELRKAHSLLRKFLRKAPTNPHAHNALGAVQMEQNDLREARRSFERAVAADPRLSDAHYNLAQVLWLLDREGSKDLAREHYLEAVALGSAPSERFAAALGLGDAPGK